MLLWYSQGLLCHGNCKVTQVLILPSLSAPISHLPWVKVNCNRWFTLPSLWWKEKVNAFFFSRCTYYILFLSLFGSSVSHHTIAFFRTLFFIALAKAIDVAPLSCPIALSFSVSLYSSSLLSSPYLSHTIAVSSLFSFSPAASVSLSPSPSISQFQFKELYWHGKHMFTLPTQLKLITNESEINNNIFTINITLTTVPKE